MAIYMKFGSINGSVTTHGFENWIELHSFQTGVSRGIGSAVRGSRGRENSEPIVSQVIVKKNMDGASNRLFQEVTGGDLSNDVTLKFTTTTKDTVTTFLTYKLTDTALSRYSLSSSGDNPQETLALSFTKLLITYTGLDPKTLGQPDTVGYDLAKMSNI